MVARGLVGHLEFRFERERQLHHENFDQASQLAGNLTQTLKTGLCTRKVVNWQILLI